MKRLARLAQLALFATLPSAAACECGESEPSFAPAPPPPGETAEPALPGAIDAHALAPATRTDLPTASPAITITIDGAHVVVTNEALLATWPPPDRERLAAAPPPDAPARWPALRSEFEVAEDAPLRVPGLVEALTATLDVERTRSGSGAPTAVALRVTGASPWANVERALFAAGMAGMSEPRFVLASGREEVELRLPLPSLEATAAPLGGPLAGRDPAEVVAAIQGALAAHPPGTSQPDPLRPTTPAPTVVAGAEAVAPTEQAPPRGTASRMLVQLGHEGLVVTRGGERLGSGCQRPAVSPAPSLPTATLTRTSARDCLLVAGATSHPYLFEAEGETTFARAAPILEVLDELGSVMIGTMPR